MYPPLGKWELYQAIKPDLLGVKGLAMQGFTSGNRVDLRDGTRNSRHLSLRIKRVRCVLNIDRESA